MAKRCCLECNYKQGVFKSAQTTRRRRSDPQVMRNIQYETRFKCKPFVLLRAGHFRGSDQERRAISSDQEMRPLPGCKGHLERAGGGVHQRGRKSTEHETIIWFYSYTVVASTLDFFRMLLHLRGGPPPQRPTSQGCGVRSGALPVLRLLQGNLPGDHGVSSSNYK